MSSHFCFYCKGTSVIICPKCGIDDKICFTPKCHHNEKDHLSSLTFYDKDKHCTKCGCGKFTQKTCDFCSSSGKIECPWKKDF